MVSSNSTHTATAHEHDSSGIHYSPLTSLPSTLQGTLYKPIKLKKDVAEQEALADLLLSLCIRDAATRLGTGAEIKAHKYFIENHLDWALLLHGACVSQTPSSTLLLSHLPPHCRSGAMPSPLVPDPKLIYSPDTVAVQTEMKADWVVPEVPLHHFPEGEAKFDGWWGYKPDAKTYASEIESLVAKSTTYELLKVLRAPPEIAGALPEQSGKWVELEGLYKGLGAGK